MPDIKGVRKGRLFFFIPLLRSQPPRHARFASNARLVLGQSWIRMGQSLLGPFAIVRNARNKNGLPQFEEGH